MKVKFYPYDVEAPVPIRTHASKDRKLRLNPKHYEGIDPREHFKPVGLWYGFGISWVEWQVDNMTENFKKNPFLHSITLSADCNLYKIKSLVDLSDMIRRYQLHKVPITDSGFVWKKLRDDGYDGIEVRNFHSMKWTIYEMPAEFELSCFLWFHGLDCDSGCIWNVDKIVSSKLVAQMRAVQDD